MKYLPAVLVGAMVVLFFGIQFLKASMLPDLEFLGYTLLLSVPIFLIAWYALRIRKRGTNRDR